MTNSLKQQDVMPRPRTSLTDLELTGASASKIKRSLAYPSKRLAKRPDLEAIFEDLLQRRADALADVQTNGLFVKQDRISNGKLYQVRVENPSLRILQTTERQIVALARVLSIMPADPKASSSEEVLAELDELLAKKGD